MQLVTRFLLGLSDQQLATGLAMLIAAIANRCQLTLYELKIVYGLAWFSATSHASTLIVLREYFYDHRVVRNIRILGIFAFMSLLSFVHIILLLVSGADIELYGRPIQCIINGSDRGPELDFLNIMVQVLPLVVLLVTCMISTYFLFANPRVSPIQTRSLCHLLFSLFPRAYRAVHPLLRKALMENSHLQHCILYSYDRPIHSHIGFSMYTDSFLSAVPRFSYYFCWGVSQIIQTRWLDAPRMADEVRTMSFGQIVAIALLAIPILTALEIYNGKINLHWANVRVVSLRGTILHVPRWTSISLAWQHNCK